MIKKITFLLICFSLLSLSCTNDIEVNTPALQVAIDGQLFNSTIKEAKLLDDGTILIYGSSEKQSLQITLPSSSIGDYKLDDQIREEVAYYYDSRKFISKTGESSGIAKITNRTDNTISGTFNFTNLKDRHGNTISFQNGWFYRIPLVPGTVETLITTPEEALINPCLLNASMTALVNTEEFIGDTHEATVIGVEDASIRITSVNDNETIEILLPFKVTSGQYTLSGFGQYSATYSLHKDKSAAQTGTLKILAHDTSVKCISGSFSFTTRSQHNIKEGTFDFGY
ncbi:DUF6252 family protein [Aquimarina sp. W85]|uniref:DUF6252 family protein n=1 Tax=Aquimarina rhodophyticola TaxID=3342246 RepID=UPI003673085D